MMCELALIDFHSSAKMAQFVLAVVVLEVDVDQVADFAVDVVDVLVLQCGDAELLEVAEGLQGVKAAGEVVEDAAKDLHQSQVVHVEDGSLSDADFHVATLEARALEDQAVLDFGMSVDYAHQVLTAGALARLWEHALGYHPTDCAAEALGDAEDLQVSFEAHLHGVALDRLVPLLLDSEVSQGGELLGCCIGETYLRLEVSHVLVEETLSSLVVIHELSLLVV